MEGGLGMERCKEDFGDILLHAIVDIFLLAHPYPLQLLKGHLAKSYLLLKAFWSWVCDPFAETLG